MTSPTTKYIAFDIETTASVPFSQIRNTDYTESSAWRDIYIGQLAWTCISEEGHVIESKSVKIYPSRGDDSRVIPVDNPFAPSITPESLVEEGVPHDAFLREFADQCLTSEWIVAHNAWFDVNLLCKELADIDEDMARQVSEKRRWCTMRRAADIDGWEKWPTMCEISETVGIEIDAVRLHDAVYDTELCARVFMEQLGRSVPPPSKVYCLPHTKWVKGVAFDKIRRRFWYYNTPSNRVRFASL